jgi:transposase
MSPSVTHVVGIDIAKDTLAVRLVTTDPSVEPVGAVQTFSNDPVGFRKVIRWLRDQNDQEVEPATTAIVMEATGVYWEGCALFFHEKGFTVRVVNPAQTHAFAKTTLQRGKTDAQDADLIARFGATVPTRVWTPPDALAEELKQIMRQRDDYVQMRVQEQNRLHALQHRARSSAPLMRMAQKHIRFLQQQIDLLETTFKEQASESPSWQKSLAVLNTLPGFGLIVAGGLLTETHGLEAFLTAKQLIAYAGLAPVPYESGSSVQRPRRISKVGNPKLRRIAYIAAVSSIRTDTVFREFYMRLRQRGKPAKVALVAVARKLLTVAFALVRSQTAFDPAYVPKRA